MVILGLIFIRKELLGPIIPRKGLETIKKHNFVLRRLYFEAMWLHKAIKEILRPIFKLIFEIFSRNFGGPLCLNLVRKALFWLERPCFG